MNNQLTDLLQKQVLLCDGGVGALIQAANLDVKKDFLGLENCSEILVQTRPDVIANIHKDYLTAGADCIETNSFGANKIVLADFDIVEKTYELNLAAAKLARKTADEFTTKDWPRFVIGSMGPGTKLPSLGQATYDELVDSYAEQARGLLDGKVDLLILETHQDLLTIKAGIQGCRIAKQERNNINTPIFAQVTLEHNGTTLVGSDMACVITTLAAMDVDGIGFNCGLGPAEMAEHVHYLSQNWNGFISVMPNAGLPVLIDGETKYLLTPEELAKWQQRFVDENGVNLIGGCCGTTPQHIAAVRTMLNHRADPKPKLRNSSIEPSASSLFTSVPFHQENAIFAIGERTNANGSKKFRELLCVDDFDGMLSIAKEQDKNGSHALDVCTAYVGRSEVKDMTHFLSVLRGQITAPIVIDSTETPVIEAGLKLLSGKSIINSINFENGEEKAATILKLAKQFGAAVIGLTIDEKGMAKETNDKIAIAKRLYDFAVNKHSLPPADLLIDPLTFTICTGGNDDREHGIRTLEAIKYITTTLPKCQTLLGASNISFGLKPAARHVLNSVFLHHARQYGITAAIIHVAKIMPLHKIPKEQIQAAEDVIFNKWQKDRDPLIHFIELFADVKKTQTKKLKPKKIEDILKQHIVEGDKKDLKEHIDTALKKYSPLEIINTHLLGGMQVVGNLFSTGQTQLPFVLQSAETMKTAVTYLESLIQHTKNQAKGILVLATVQGDVHDIGKNLVDIILTNNGYKVINLGIKQSASHIIEAAKKYKANAIGMSGLLVKSTIIMKENIEEMKRQGINIPIILGGAALTSGYVEQDCNKAYGKENKVYYAKDAFSCLKIMDQIISS
jgi:5-methyltetrahydrofolate--homocysteine methyltransferase